MTSLATLPRGLPKRQAIFLLNLSFAPSLDRSDYQNLTGACRATARSDLSALLRAGLITRLGRGRGTRYALLDRQNA